MSKHREITPLRVVAVILIASKLAAADPLPPIARRLPPPGDPLEPEVRQQLVQRLEHVQRRLSRQAQHPLVADVRIFSDAVRFALRYNEFYNGQDANTALELLASANERLDALESESAPWTRDHGLIVRGYVSSIDGSTQPYGLVVPDTLDLSNPVPLYVWLHGRGDTTTNLGFLHRRMTQVGRVAPSHAIVLHPWGRHCVGYKSAGEIDVLEAVDHVASQYKIDPDRVVLMGFSMGGAGCWHIGAHYPDRWVALSPGAGFAETARYQNINPEQVPWYERRLWGLYDVPAYVRNLFNLPVIAYSGEIDRQIQAARVMELAYAEEGQRLSHLIGPGAGHRYNAQTLVTLLDGIKRACDRGRDRSPTRITLQTRTLRYHRVHWVDVQRLEEHWRDTRVDAELTADRKLNIATRNVLALRLTPELAGPIDVSIDGQRLRVTPDNQRGSTAVQLVKQQNRWTVGKPDERQLAKRPGLQGPIDDAFLDPFLVVLPSGTCAHPTVQRWVEFEQTRFLDRWQALFRGEPRIKDDREVTAEDLQKYHLVLWGDPTSNTVLSRVANHLPIRWTKQSLVLDQREFKAQQHALAMVYPNPEAPHRYLVLNSGSTFREGHDRTNSLQNPKLADWAVLDLTQPPDDLYAGRVVATDFFDEQWRLQSSK